MKIYLEIRGTGVALGERIRDEQQEKTISLVPCQLQDNGIIQEDEKDSSVQEFPLLKF